MDLRVPEELVLLLSTNGMDGINKHVSINGTAILLIFILNPQNYQSRKQNQTKGKTLAEKGPVEN